MVTPGHHLTWWKCKSFPPMIVWQKSPHLNIIWYMNERRGGFPGPFSSKTSQFSTTVEFINGQIEWPWKLGQKEMTPKIGCARLQTLAQVGIKSPSLFTVSGARHDAVIAVFSKPLNDGSWLGHRDLVWLSRAYLHYITSWWVGPTVIASLGVMLIPLCWCEWALIWQDRCCVWDRYMKRKFGFFLKGCTQT